MSLEASIGRLQIDESVALPPNEQIPEGFDSENDNLNWRKSCNVLGEFTVQTDTLEEITNRLKGLSN
jgi:hypothetical protein